MDAVQQPVPPVIRRAERGAFREHAAGEQVGHRGRAVRGRHFHAHQAVEDVLPFPGPQPERPLADRRDAPGLGRIERAPVRVREPEEAIELRPVERKGGVALHDADHPGIAGPGRAFGQRPIHHQPALRARPIALPHRQLQRAPGTVEHPTGIGQVAHRMRRFVGGQGDAAKAGREFARGRQRLGACDRQELTGLDDGRQSAVPSFADRRRHLADDHRGRPRVGQENGPLYAVEKRQRAGPGLRRADRVPLQPAVLLERRGSDAGLRGPAAARFGHDGRRREPPHRKFAAQMGQIDERHVES